MYLCRFPFSYRFPFLVLLIAFLELTNLFGAPSFRHRTLLLEAPFLVVVLQFPECCSAPGPLFLFMIGSDQVSHVSDTCVGRYATVSKKCADFGVTGLDQGILVVGHKAKLALGVEGGPREESFDVFIFADRNDAMLASERLLTANNDIDLSRLIEKLSSFFVLSSFKELSRKDLQRVAPIRGLTTKWPEDTVAGGVAHRTVGRQGLLELMLEDADRCQRICSVNSLCVGVTTN